MRLEPEVFVVGHVLNGKASAEYGDCILSFIVEIGYPVLEDEWILCASKASDPIFGTQISIGTDGYHNLIPRDGEWEIWRAAEWFE